MWGKRKQKKKPELWRREPRRFWYSVSAGACAAILLVAVRGELGLYIHPRYQAFTIIMMVAALLLLAVATVQYQYKKQTHIEFSSLPHLVWIFGRWLFRRGAWIPFLVVLFIVFLPAQPLLSDAAERRQLNEYEQQHVKDASWFYRPATIYQLSSVIQFDDGLERQLGKEFTLSGFVDDDSNPDIFRLSRFTFSCCVVDARPVAIAIYMPGWQEKFDIDEWVEVTGTLDTFNAGATHRTILMPSEVNEAERPKDPYDYL